MKDIQCCGCGAITRGRDAMVGAFLTVQSGFTKSAADSCDNCGHDFCDECLREDVIITVIEIESDVKAYLDKILFGDAQEAHYTAGIKLDMEDYNGAIKQMANRLYFERCLTNDTLSLDDMPFEDGIRRLEDVE